MSHQRLRRARRFPTSRQRRGTGVSPELLIAMVLPGFFCVAIGMTYPRTGGSAPILAEKVQSFVADTNFQIEPESFAPPNKSRKQP